MPKMKMTNIYTAAEIDKICNEIDRQWENHLTCRAVFFSGMDLRGACKESPSYYVQKGIDIKFQLPTPLTPILERTLIDAPNWQNQNYIIRLFGILDAPGLIRAGKDQTNKYAEIVALLRSRVGAHSSGTHRITKGDSKKAQKLIHEHLDSSFSLDDLEAFNLSIDAVLEPLKNQCIEFVRSMEGKEKPDRSTKCKEKSA
jgi:hypothetical protein